MPDKNTLTLGLVQHASPGLDAAAKQRNLDHCCDMIRDAAAQGAQLVATQELFLTEYFCQIEDEARFNLAEPIPGPTTQRLGELAKELKIEITASLFEKRTAGVYHNTSVMIGRDGTLIDRYRKMHIPDDPRFYEKYYFTPGDPPAPGSPGTPGTPGASGGLGWRAQQTTHAKTGMLICWDQWFPEAARLTAMHGAQVLFYPTAIGWYHGETDFDRKQQREAWQIMQRSHAIANGVFVAAINRVGTEGDLTFWGRSFVCDPGGVVLAEAPENDEAVLVVECDFNRIEELRRGWPFLRDRRIDAYQPLTKRLLDE